MPLFFYIVIGLVGGICAGAFGIGGGAVMVPALVLFFGLTQHQAQGTILAVLMIPVSVLAVMRYYKSGNVKVDAVLLIALGFVFGALIGAHYIQGVSDANLKRAFGVFLILIGIRMALFK